MTDSTPEHNATNEPVTFQPPEVVADHDTSDPKDSEVVVSHHQDPTRKNFKLKDWWHKLSKKQKIIGIIGIALIIVVAGILTFVFTRSTKPIPLPPKPVATKPKPTTVPSTLTGLPVNPSVNERPVTGVMIENSDFARPQSGLNEAGVVFEAIAEAGITRFLALYQDTQPDYLGPIRSARPYFLEWDLGFDAALAHVGESPEAQNDISAWHVRDLNQFYNGGFYERITSRYAPHNVYSSATQLNALEKSKGFYHSQFRGFLRKSDSPSKTPNAASININPSGPDFADHYVYVTKTNNYKRYMAGSPHMEIEKSGKQAQITPKVVIAMVMSYSIESDGYHSQYGVIGKGKVYIFQDGTVTIGTWSKSSRTSQITFTNVSGQPIRLDAGQTWLTAVSSTSDVSYQ